MIRWVPRGLGTTALALLTGWVALISWQGLVQSSYRFLGPALVCAVIVGAVGVLARSARLPWLLTPLLQLVACGLYVNARYAAPASLAGVVPTRASLQSLVETVQEGASALNTYVAPVSSQQTSVYPYLLLGCVVVLVLIDLLASGLGRVPLAGLPILLALSIPISILDQSLSWGVFVATTVLFLLLLSTEEVRRVLGWGRSVAGRSTHPSDSHDPVPQGASVRSAALRIGVATSLGALLLPLLVPVIPDLFGLRDGGSGTGGGGTNVRINNPLVDLRRDLVRSDPVPLLYVRTTDTDPSYIRTTVLDQFNGSQWKPSQRDLPRDNRADGILPNPPGLTPQVGGTQRAYDFTITSNFETRWLPVPYPTRSVQVPGDWRFDSTTLDIVDTDPDGGTSGLQYSALGIAPQITPSELDDAEPAPDRIFDPMTELPGDLPAAIAQTARRVTAGASTNYERAVALQDWFRSQFVYSLNQRPGSGEEQLARFITTDRVGYCEQFAAAMATMGRTLNIPSRVAVGFLRPQRTGENRYVFTTDALHAWPEMFVSGIGWVRFEPTPAIRTGESPGYTRPQADAPTPVTPTPSSEPAAPPAASAPQSQAQQPDTPQDPDGSASAARWPWVALAVLLLLAAAASPRLLRERRRRRWLSAGLEGRPPVRSGAPATASVPAQELAEGAWLELAATARDYGIPWPRERSARSTLATLVRRERPGSELVDDTTAFATFIERARYARPFELDEGERRMVLRTVEGWRSTWARSVSPLRARIASVLPASVLSRAGTAPVATTPQQDAAVERVGERV